jgi:hypothetical protein
MQSPAEVGDDNRIGYLESISDGRQSKRKPQAAASIGGFVVLGLNVLGGLTKLIKRGIANG